MDMDSDEWNKNLDPSNPPPSQTIVYEDETLC